MIVMSAGSLADITAGSRHVRFTPNSGHRQVALSMSAFSAIEPTLRPSLKWSINGPFPANLPSPFSLA